MTRYAVRTWLRREFRRSGQSSSASSRAATWGERAAARPATAPVRLAVGSACGPDGGPGAGGIRWEPWRPQIRANSGVRRGMSRIRVSERVFCCAACMNQAEGNVCSNALADVVATRHACGWVKDPFGPSGQIVPRRFMEPLHDRNSKKVQAVADAKMTMVKFEVGAHGRAYHEAQPRAARLAAVMPPRADQRR